MFDLITGKTPHMPRGGRGATLLSSALHAGVLGFIVIVPVMFATNTLPEVPAMMAFVALPAPPPAPPPPPPPPSAQGAPVKAAPSNPNAAPAAAPSRIDPEPQRRAANVDPGAAGGVEGGVPGGIAGGIVGGISEVPPPPPPPPPQPAPVEPFRIGGDIRPPTLLHRVEPTYPDLALRAHVAGTVILEAIIDAAGAVQSVNVLRSVPLLDTAAMDAVEQWRYAPTILNGRPVPVKLTVVLTFKIPIV
jgi:protein TonB